jgi:predicted amidohydrolase YtcJ
MEFNTMFCLCISLLLTTLACGGKEQADLVIYNAQVYTVDDQFTQAEAFAVRDGKFIAVGENDEILAKYDAPEALDLQGTTIYPGFIDAHAHFYGYGTGLQIADLTGASSFDELTQRLVRHREEHPEQPWLLGRGWDQNLWEKKAFPSREKLDELFPNIPVLLTRIDGHAALANKKALELGGITSSTSMLGGKVMLERNVPTGILIDNAIGLVSEKIPGLGLEEKKKALLAAQENCFQVGLTTVADAGLDREIIELMEEMQVEGNLKMRIYAMVNPSAENQAHYFERGPYQTDRMTVRSFKIFGDGALGSRGAALLKPYHDAPDEQGFLLSSVEEFEALAKEMYEHGFQMNTHCIGDSTNRTILDIYAKVLKGENDRRWRIEHAQIVSSKDVEKFGENQIIPSVQPTHATSDMYWAEDRLGSERIHDAYIFKKLLDQNGYIALGSDFPVEAINPLYGFHAAVARQDAAGWPEEGFQAKDKLSREEALKGMTIWAAFANFEEDKKGSIEAGKLADFVILEQDIITAPAEELRDIAVIGTYLGGEKVY